MTNTQRNTTVLAVLLSIVVATGTVVVQRLNKLQANVKSQNTKLSAEIFKYDKLILMKPRLEKDFTELRLMLANQSKVIAHNDTPAATYRYLLNLMEWADIDIPFDFSMSKTEGTATLWNEYIISGKYDYRDFALFISNLEYQRALLTLQDVTIAQESLNPSDSVAFSIIFRTHYASDGTPLETITSKAMTKHVPRLATFKPRIYDGNVDTSEEFGLLRLETCKVMGITESRVFLRDSKGIIHILAVGSPVAYGRLAYIDQNLDKAVFKINQYGVDEEKTLYLRKNE